MAPLEKEQVAATIGMVPEVERVYMIPIELSGALRVLTIVDREDEDVFKTIYEQELALARAMKGARLDFAVIARYGRPVEHIVRDSRPVWEKAVTTVSRE